MFERIAIAYDGSDGALAALRVAIVIARSTGAELASLSVEERLPRYAASIDEIEEAQERIEAHFRAITKQARDVAALEGVELESAVRRGREADEILAFARDGRVGLLVLGSHGHSRMFERIIGSTSLSVARVAPCSVLVVRPRRPAAPLFVQRIVVGVDGSPLGRLAFDRALEFARLFAAAVVGVTVREASPLARPEPLESSYVERLRSAALAHAAASGVAFEHVVRTGHAAHELRAAAAEHEADLLVLGATGLERPWSVTIGGTAATVLAEAQCSVALVRPAHAALHVRDVMVRAVSSVSVDEPLSAVVELLLRRNVKAVPVVDEARRVVGIVTGGDLLARGELGLRLSVKQELDDDVLRARVRALAQSRRTARDVMSRHVQTIEQDADLATAIALMARRRVKRLPVVDEDRTLVGIVSRADVLRALAALPPATEAETPALGVGARSVGEVSMTQVPLVAPDAPADDVLGKLLGSPLRRVVVTDAAGKVIGLISDRDVLARATPEHRPGILRLLLGPREGPGRHAPSGTPLTASALMAPSLITVRPEDSLAHAIRLMMQHRVKRLIVVDEADRFRGLVDRRAILAVLAGKSSA